MRIDLLKLQQERVVTLDRVDRGQPGVRDTLRQLLLLSVGEQPVAFDADNERGLLNEP